MAFIFKSKNQDAKRFLRMWSQLYVPTLLGYDVQLFGWTLVKMLLGMYFLDAIFKSVDFKSSRLPYHTIT